MTGHTWIAAAVGVPLAALGLAIWRYSAAITRFVNAVNELTPGRYQYKENGTRLIGLLALSIGLATVVYVVILIGSLAR